MALNLAILLGFVISAFWLGHSAASGSLWRAAASVVAFAGLVFTWWQGWTFLLRNALCGTPFMIIPVGWALASMSFLAALAVTLTVRYFRSGSHLLPRGQA